MGISGGMSIQVSGDSGAGGVSRFAIDGGVSGVSGTGGAKSAKGGASDVSGTAGPSSVSSEANEGHRMSDV